MSRNQMGLHYLGKRLAIGGLENRHEIQLIELLYYIIEKFHVDCGTLHHVLCHTLWTKNAPNAIVATPARNIKLPRDNCWAECGFSSAIRSGAVSDILELICQQPNIFIGQELGLLRSLKLSPCSKLSFYET